MRTVCRLACLSPLAVYYKPEKNARPLNAVSIKLIRKVVEDITFYGSKRVVASICRNAVRINMNAGQRLMRAMD